MRPVTARQQEVLSFIQSFIQTNRYPPTIREIAESFNVSVKAAHDHVKALEKKEMIRYDANRSRTIEVLVAPEEEVQSPELLREIPILGSVAAGLPVLAAENLEGTIAVPEEQLSKEVYFALRVRGDSMSGAGILDGDVAVIKQQAVADNGDIVVAMVDEAVTIKRFFREPSRVQLRAENPRYSPIYTRDVRILGRLSQIIRQYE